MLGKILKDAREKAKMSQTEVAAAASVDRVYLSNIGRERKVPTVYLFLRICRGIGVSPATVIRQVEIELEKQKELERRVADL